MGLSEGGGGRGRCGEGAVEERQAGLAMEVSTAGGELEVGLLLGRAFADVAAFEPEGMLWGRAL